MTDTLPEPVPGAVLVPLPDGRVLEVLELGDPDGVPLLFHGGQPSAATPFAQLDTAARAQALRVIAWSRPGYGASTPRPLPETGPRIADDLPDVVALLDHLGVEDFLTLGWSGGGPRALACAALLPARCRGAASLAGAAPYDAEGLDWSAGMAPENVEEYAAARAGAETYGEQLTVAFLPAVEAGAEDIAASLGELVTPVDVAAVEGGLASWLAEQFRRSGAQGVRGVRDDGLALVQPWGFDLADITTPTAIWQGTEDAMVPFSHGQWLADHVAGTRAHLLDGEGHLSPVHRLEEILADLRDLAGLPPAR